MSRLRDLNFHAGETWVITGTVRDSVGSIIPLGGASYVCLRVSDGTNDLLDLVTPADGSIISPTQGTYRFSITPEQQALAGIVPDEHYGYELKAYPENYGSTVQNHGIINVKTSLFYP